MSISRSFLLAATAGLAAAPACAPSPGQAVPDPGVKPVVTQVLRLDQLYLLEMAGIPPEDTAVTFAKGSLRIVSLRHGVPDNTVFAELIFPADAFGDSAARDSVTVRLHPRPGVYGADITVSVPPQRGALIRFKYPIHFAAPNAGLVQYGSRTRFEEALAIAVQRDSTTFNLMASERPASDNLQAPFGGSGTYLVAAPR